MLGLIHWTRSFTYDKDGAMIKNANGAVFAAHPQPNLWALIEANAKELAKHFDVIQLPPAARGPGEGYAATELRDYNSNWGTAQELIAAIDACHEAGMKVSADFSVRQMQGENGGPGVFKYNGRPGETTASWFQDYGQNGEKIPPFVPQDDIPSTEGNHAFGRVRSNQHCIPAGVVEADTTDVLKGLVALGVDLARYDDVKAQHAPSVARVMASQKGFPFYGEYFSGNPAELNWWATSAPMNGRAAVEDFTQYWHCQAACNGYDATQFDRGGGYWQWRSDLSVGFVSNPDVATSWSPTGGISQQIAFNLLLGIALCIGLPFWLFLIYAEDYFPASPDFPAGRGLKPFIDNMAWFARRYAVGNFERRWVDKDVYCYTRDGAGGVHGWSGGCLVAVNFNTLHRRQVTVQTTWAQGTHVHNYSATGRNEYAYVGAGGKLSLDLQSNAYSSGQSYQLWAVA